MLPIQFGNHFSLKSDFLNSINPIQKKVYFIAVLIFGFVVTAAYIVYRCFFKKQPAIGKEKDNEIKNNLEKNGFKDIKNMKNQAEIDKAKSHKDESSVPKSTVTYSPLTVTSNSVESEVYKNRDGFNQFLLNKVEKKPSIETLLQETICKGNFSKEPIVFHQISTTTNEFEKVLNKRIQKGDTSIRLMTSPKLYQYDQKGHFYVDFAHAKFFGGSYRVYGCLQEERMFAEIPVLALLDYEMNGQIRTVKPMYGKEFPPLAKPNPFIIESVCRQFDISQTPYGDAFKNLNEENHQKEIIDKIQPVKIDNQIPVNIIGIAAIDYKKKKPSKYEFNDLLYHLEAAYVAFSGAKEIAKKQKTNETVVHTGAWGCGGFLNSVKMMVAIQCLAAEMAGVDLEFDFVQNNYYSENNIRTIHKEIRKWIDEGKSPDKILKNLEGRASDPNSKGWSPRRQNR